MFQGCIAFYGAAIVYNSGRRAPDYNSYFYNDGQQQRHPHRSRNDVTFHRTPIHSSFCFS